MLEERCIFYENELKALYKDLNVGAGVKGDPIDMPWARAFILNNAEAIAVHASGKIVGI